MRTAFELLIAFLIPLVAALIGWFWTEDFRTGCTVGLWAAGATALVIFAAVLWGLWRDFQITRLRP